LIDIVAANTPPAKTGLRVTLVYEEAFPQNSGLSGAELAAFSASAKADGFKGQKDASYYAAGPRRLFLGLGKRKEADLERFRRAALAAARRARDLKAGDASIALPEGAGKDEAGAVAEGAWLGLYKFSEAKGVPKDKDGDARAEEAAFKRLTVVGGGKGAAEVLAEKRLVCEAVCLVRDLVNRGPKDKIPTKYARDMQALAKGVKGVTLKIMEKKAIQAWPMAGLLTVNQGSQNPPVFMHLHYKPAGKARKTVALVGKGVTFDSGGLSLKPAGSMLDMKCDMAGSATALALGLLAAKLKLPVEVHACAPVTENLPGADAVKIGDVIRYKNGRTAEVLNSDAEGRLILADGLLYAEALKPDVILDFATLTGAAIVALGMNISALMGDDGLCERLKKLGERTGESFWQLPLPEAYHSHIESKVADIKNIGNSGEAGTIAAAFYLKEFVTTKAWVHFDIAGPAFLKAEDGVNPAGGTGVPVRTVLEFLKGL
jgi:leucyl aminopeptidase